MKLNISRDHPKRKLSFHNRKSSGGSRDWRGIGALKKKGFILKLNKSINKLRTMNLVSAVMFKEVS